MSELKELRAELEALRKALKRIAARESAENLEAWPHEALAALEMKRCIRCQTVKPLRDFYRDRARSDGLQNICKVCDKKRPRKPSRPDVVKRSARRYRARHPEKGRAHTAVATALASGELVRPDRCELCGERPPPTTNGRASIHAHHDDYSKPLDVRWLCHPCHEREHQAERDETDICERCGWERGTRDGCCDIGTRTEETCL